MNLGNTTGRKHCKVNPEKRKPGIFYVKEFANWLTGFKTDETTHSSELPVSVHRVKPTVAKRYF